MVVDWNATGKECGRDGCIHELFSEQARRRGAEVAVVFGGRKLSYGELDERSEQLAEYLHRIGVRRGCRVGVCLERSVEMVVGFLGILKAGAAYVPIDPGYPEERVRLMLEEAKAAVLLSSEPEGWRFADQRIRSVNVEELLKSPRPPEGEGERDGQAVHGEDEAYVLFTSGSTGKPKGVCVPHRAVINLVVNSDYLELQSRRCSGANFPLLF